MLCMSDLANYSIETDQVVLLSFKDGRSLRVPLNHLSRYLKPGDLAKVKKALNLRRHFLRIHMPRFFVILATIGGLVALLTVGGKTVASLLGHPRPANQTPSHTGIARSRLEPTPDITPSAGQPVQGNVRLTAAGRHVKSLGQAAVPVPTAAPAPAQPPIQLTSQTTVSQPATTIQSSAAQQIPPASAPAPNPAPSPSPTASPAPTQTPAPQGHVLSDATSSAGSTTAQ